MNTKLKLRRRNLDLEKMSKVILHNNVAIKQSMRNKFNYNGREVQTVYPEVKERGVATAPATTEDIRGEIMQWDIWDSYIEEFKREQRE